MDFETYIKPEFLVLIPVLYIIGMIFKRTERFDDRFIPSVLGICGILFALIWTIGTDGFSLAAVFTAATQGVLVAGAAVYTNQLFKQYNKEADDYE